jgi:Periplasmic serine proteases (ClpP class)
MSCATHRRWYKELMSWKKKIGQLRDALGDVPVIGGIVKPKPKIAVVRLAGVIADAGVRKSGLSYARCEQMIEDAFDVYNLQAVALVVNSPGGSPSQSELIANLIRAEAKDKEIPVYAFVEDVAASGGYWLACKCGPHLRRGDIDCGTPSE